MTEASNYKWNYISLGGVVRVKISKGEDIAHLGELDQKKWTVLGCPVDNLDLDPETLALIDTDGDGSIRVPEVKAAAAKLTALLKDPDLILEGRDNVSLDDINPETPEGKEFIDSATNIINFLGKDDNKISISDTTSINDTENHIKCCMAYDEWYTAGQNDKSVKPFGDDTAAALAAMEALDSKVKDYFMRCKLIRFNSGCSDTLDSSCSQIGEVANLNLNDCKDKISECPLAHPTADAVLPYDAINPAWQEAFDAAKSMVLDKLFKKAGKITEDQWQEALDKFSAYKTWIAAKKGGCVEAEGIDKIRETIAENAQKIALGASISLSSCVKCVNDDLILLRDFSRLVRNYITFSDFYQTGRKCRASFEIGDLYIDQRCCNLCIRIKDMNGHADMASLSGMFLIYCHCKSKTCNKEMDIAAVMTDGSTRNLRPGKRAIFYDLKGNDWDAVVTKIVDNPINIRQAFFSPYRKFANFISEKINKSAEQKESNVISSLQSAAENASLDKKPELPAAPFDIAKFAGIFAAIGMALGYIGAFLTKIVDGATANPLGFIGVLVAVMLCISGPSCFIAWSKLRRRNLGPVLNANGWAINSVVLVNILFGRMLTSTAKYPIIKGKSDDPFKKKSKKGIIIACAALVVAAVVLYFILRNRGI